MASSRAVRPQLLADDDLLSRFQSGDRSSYAELWRRHAPSGLTAARSFTSVSDAEDVVAEAFTRIFQAAQSGVGPIGAFRPYLYATIRNVVLQNAARGDRITDVDLDTIPAVEIDPEAVLDNSLISSAFRSLPERWQTVLWYLEVEKLSTREAGELLGIKANAVAALAFRARGALRSAWLQTHVGESRFTGEHRETLALLGDYSRGAATSREHKKVTTHLATCAACSRIASEVDYAAGRIAMSLLIVVLGGSAAAMFAHAAAAAQSSALTAASALLPPIPDFSSLVAAHTATVHAAAASASATAGASSAGASGAATGAAATAAVATTGTNLALVGLLTGSLIIVGGASAAITVANRPAASIRSMTSPQPLLKPGKQAPASARIVPDAIPSSFAEPVVPISTRGNIALKAPIVPFGADSLEKSLAPVVPIDSADPTPTSTPTPTIVSSSPVITDPVSNVTISPLSTVIVTGTGHPGETITGVSETAPPGTTSVPDARDNTVQTSSVVVSPDGAWSWASAVLSDGSHSLSFSQQAAGEIPSPAVTRWVTVDTVFPAAPIVNHSWSNTDLVAPTLTGTAEPGNIVLISDIAGRDLKSVTADVSGQWTSGTVPGITPGMSGLRVSQIDLAGHRSLSATIGPFAFIPTVTPSVQIFLGSPLGFSVTGWPGSTVMINAKGQSGGSFVLDARGLMTLTFTADISLAPGDYIYFLNYPGQAAFVTLTAKVPQTGLASTAVTAATPWNSASRGDAGGRIATPSSGPNIAVRLTNPPLIFTHPALIRRTEIL